MILAMLTAGLVGVVSLSISSWTQSSVHQSRQANLSGVADQIRSKVVNLVESPWAWEYIKSRNQGAFNSAGYGSDLQPGGYHATVPNLDLYTADSTGNNGTIYYRASNPNAGFDIYGEPCDLQGGQGFDANNGNDQCPFRYDITLASRVQRDGVWIDTIRFEFKFKPRSPGLILNVSASKYTFDLVRNYSTGSVESTCTLLRGAFDKNSGSCSTSLTPQANCEPGTTYVGLEDSPCAQLRLGYSCSSGVIVGIAADGTPVCGSVQN